MCFVHLSQEAIRILEEEDAKRLKLEADRRARAAAEESRRLEAERVKRLEEIEERRKLQEAERQKEKVRLFLILVWAIRLMVSVLFTGGPARKGTSSQGGGG